MTDEGLDQDALRELEEAEERARLLAERLAELKARRDSLGELSEQEVFGVLRRRNAIKQRDIAIMAKTTQSYLSAWESGRWTPPDRRVRSYWDALEQLIAAQDLPASDE